MYSVRALILASCVLPAFAQYAGPAILSRGEAPAAMAKPGVDFRPFVSVTANYSSGLATVAATNAAGDLASDTAYGAGVNLGLSGTHNWRHTSLGLSYGASFYHYNKASYFDSVNQHLSLELTHQFTRHIIFSLTDSAGMFSRQYTPLVLSQTVGFDTTSQNIPSTDFYDNRTIYNSTDAWLTIQRSTRLSFGLGGSLFGVARRSQALHGTVGAAANGDVQYRLSRRATIGAMYAFTYYHVQRLISSTDVHTFAATYAVRISRLTEFSGYGGVSRVEEQYIQTVPVDPAIASLLGIASTNIITHRLLDFPTFGARLSRTLMRGVVYAHAGEMVNPGNGLFFASRSVFGGVGYGYNGRRNWSANINLNYHDSWSFANIDGHYSGLSGALSLGRHLFGDMNFVASVYTNRYRSRNFANYDRSTFSASAGLAWSPGKVPVRLW